MKTVLIAVIASAEDPYPHLVKTSQATWDSLGMEGVDSFYYFDRGFREILPRTITLDEGGGLHDMGRRDLLGYRWALDNRQWDYMARVNASCYVRKSLLRDYVQTLPDAGLFCGVMYGAAKPEDSFLWGGAHFVMSRDVVKAFVDNAAAWDHHVMEDVAMSRLAQRLGIPFDTRGRAASINKKGDGWLCLCYNGKNGGFEFKDFAEMKKLDDQHFIRVKQDLQRHLDVMIMQELHKNGV